MSKFDTFLCNLRLLIGLATVMMLAVIGGFWMMLERFTSEMVMAFAATIVLSFIYLVMGRWTKSMTRVPGWSERQKLGLQVVATRRKSQVVMWYKGQPFDFITHDPTQPDPVDWVGIPAS